MCRGAVCSLLLVALTGCAEITDWLETAAFSLQVTPNAIRDSIPGQRCVFLVTVQNEAGDCGPPVWVTASATAADVTVQPALLWPGLVGEITVVPAPAAETPDDGRDITVEIRAWRGGFERAATVVVHVTSEEHDQLAPAAAEVRDLFIPWLAANRPDLGISGATQWQGTIVSPHILVVSHYLYFSADWEMHVWWHIMIPPYDWARIELRRRFVEMVPSLAFEIPSRSATLPAVHQIEPEGTLWR
jgi:hypothetical protein